MSLKKVVDNSDTLSEAFTTEQAGDFMDLFTGNVSGFGQYTITESKISADKDSQKFWVASGKVRIQNVIKHLSGVVGLGVSPIQSNDNCLFGCIDDDEHHKTGIPVDIRALEKRIQKAKLPLIPCASRTGGAHLYVFFSAPVAAVKVRGLLSTWASALLIQSNSEIFPKQIHISPSGYGNSINVPYFNAQASNTYAISNGNPQPVGSFINMAHASTISPADVDEFLGGEHKEAPPCLQSIIRNGCVQGNRNEAIYNMTIYMKKRSPSTFSDDVLDLNRTVFKAPLGTREARRTISSASRSDYKYRCAESPCRDFCNRDVCITRKYGIDPQTYEEPVNNFITNLKKHATQPVQWEMMVREKPVFVSTSVLLDYRRLMVEVTEAVGFVLPGMKATEWLRIVSPMVESAPVIAAPADSTSGGLLWSKLQDFSRRARLSPTDKDRDPLLRGQPIMEKVQDNTIVHFRGKDFLEYLRRKRHGEIRPNIIWIALKNAGVRSGRLRVNNKSISVWSVLVDLNEDEQAVPKFGSDF